MKDIHLIDCPLCGGAKHSTVYGGRLRGDESGKVKVVYCNDCSLMFLNPVFTLQEYSEFYKQSYRKVSRNVDNDNGKIFDTELRGASIVSRLSTYLSKEAEILEIGSGNGGILNAFKLAGFEKVTGVEPNLEEAEFCKQALGITVYNELFDGNLEKKFDLIIISGTIDHIQMPNEFLASVYNQLKPQGLIYVDSHDSVKQLTTADTFFKVDHCFYYSPFTLSSIIMNNGFRVIAFRQTNDYSSVVSYAHTPLQLSISADNPHFFVIGRKVSRKTNFSPPSLNEIHPWLLRVELRLIRKYSSLYLLRRFYKRILRRLRY